MKKHTLMTMAFFAIIIMSGFGCAKPSEISDDTSLASSSQDTKDAGDTQGLLPGRTAQKCTYETPQGERGTIYTDGKRVYVEVRNAPVPGEIGKNVNMINDGTTVYTWDLATGKGQKMALSPTDAMGDHISDDMDVPSSATPPVGATALDAEHDLVCTTWRTDESTFVPPTTVTFTDMNAITKQLSGAKATAQQACAQLTGKEKVACEEALNAFVE